MKKVRILLVVVGVLVLTGCPKDDRIRRLASLHNVKTHTAAKELKAATTDQQKVEIAEEYFRKAPEETQLIEDYMFGREPTAVKENE